MADLLGFLRVYLFLCTYRDFVMDVNNLLLIVLDGIIIVVTSLFKSDTAMLRHLTRLTARVCNNIASNKVFTSVYQLVLNKSQLR